MGWMQRTRARAPARERKEREGETREESYQQFGLAILSIGMNATACGASEVRLVAAAPFAARHSKRLACAFVLAERKNKIECHARQLTTALVG